MAILNCWVSDEDYKELELAAQETGRTIENLAEGAISEAICMATRHKRNKQLQQETKQ